MSRFAYDNGFHGIAYISRFDDNFDCWAIFEGARFDVVDRVPIARDDPDLLYKDHAEIRITCVRDTERQTMSTGKLEPWIMSY